MRFLLTIFICLLASERVSHAFPQMISHGYTSCTACHMSPSGGGMLTPYGRSLSREVLSQFGTEKETGVLHGLVTPPEWLLVGGDIRLIQTYVNTPVVERAKFFIMQMDLELGAQMAEKWRVIASIGPQAQSSVNFTGSAITSRKHYVQYSIDDTQSLRLGRFGVAFGVGWADHFLFSKRDLGWDEGSETYQLEWHRLKDEWESLVSVSLGRPETQVLDAEKSVSGRMTYSFKEKNQLGLSFYYGGNSSGSRVVTGPLFLLTPFSRLTLLGEVDLQRLLGGTRGIATGIVQTLRVNYELLKGIHLYGQQEWERLNFDSAAEAKQAYTLGTQWFFRPHVEVTAAWRKQKTSPVGFTDLAWVIFHYYI